MSKIPFDFKKGHALTVGVGKREKVGNKKVDDDAMAITAADAERVKTELIAPYRVSLPKENVKCLTNKDATKEGLLNELDNLIKKTKKSRAEMVIIYFSGHGYMKPDPHSKEKKYYLICHDTVDADIENTAISGSVFVGKLLAINTINLLILLDCCHSGGIYKSVDIPFSKEILVKPNRAIISACRPSEDALLSKPLSIFTYALVEGLAGIFFETDTIDVCLNALAMYTRERVSQLSKNKQRPELNNVQQLPTKDFVIVRYPKGNPTSAFPKGSKLRTFNKGKGINTSIAPEKDEEYRRQFAWMKPPSFKKLIGLKKDVEKELGSRKEKDEQKEKANAPVAEIYYDEDIIGHNKPIEYNLNSAEAYFNRGRANFNKGDSEGAIKDFDRAIDLKPDFVFAYYMRGIAKSYIGDDTGDYRSAIADYDHVIALLPNDADAYYNRGLAKDSMQNHDGAITDFNSAIILNARHDKAYNKRGIAKDSIGDYEGAFGDFEHAINLNHDYADAYYNRGTAKGKKGDYLGAIADYDDAINLEPDNAATYYMRGVGKYSLADYKGAITDYDHVIKLKPDFVVAYFYRGNVKNKTGDYEEAIADFDHVIESESVYAEAYYAEVYNNRGNAKDMLRDYQGAIADLTHAIDLRPGYIDAYYNRGFAKYSAGDYAGAIADFDRAIALYPDYASAILLRDIAKDKINNNKGA